MSDEMQPASDEMIRDLLEGMGKDHGVPMAYPFPILVGYDHHPEEFVVGKEGFFKGQPLGRILSKGEYANSEPPNVLGCWWVEVLDFDLFMSSEGHIWDFPEIPRDMEVFQKFCDEFFPDAAGGV